MQETLVISLSWEDPLEKEMVAHFRHHDLVAKQLLHISNLIEIKISNQENITYIKSSRDKRFPVSKIYI